MINMQRVLLNLQEGSKIVEEEHEDIDIPIKLIYQNEDSPEPTRAHVFES